MLNIFVVDDDDSSRVLYQRYLTLEGYNIIASAKNGEDAIKTFKELSHKPDYILMDYFMPFKNGIEATEEILKIDPKAKIIIMSSDLSAKEKALSAGAVCFSKKVLPFKTFLNNIKSKICP